MKKATTQNAIDSIVKTLSQVKRETAKPSKPVLTLSIDEQIRLAREAGEAKGIELNQKEIFTKCANALRDSKAVIGDARKCPLAKAFLAARFPATVAGSTKANALSAFRIAVETGKEYSENTYRKPDTKKETKKTGAKTADTKKATHIEATETATTYQCTIARKGSAKKAAQVLRDLVNKMRESEEYALLAALVIDSLDEFDSAE